MSHLFHIQEQNLNIGFWSIVIFIFIYVNIIYPTKFKYLIEQSAI